MTIELKPLKNTFRYNCPHCSITLSSVTAEGLEVTFPATITDDDKSTPWLLDGDAIPGLLEALEPARVRADGWAAMLYAGRCLSCLKTFYTVAVELVNGDWSAYLDYVGGLVEPSGPDRHLLAHAEQVDPGFAAVVAGPWVLTETPTPAGPVHEHMFGPFALQQWSAIAGEHGVSACQGRGSDGPWILARDLVLSIWDDIQATHRSALEETP